MELGWKFTCTCHQGKITKCCQTPLDFQQAELNLQSNLLFDHSKHTYLKVKQQLKIIYLPIIGKL